MSKTTGFLSRFVAVAAIAAAIAIAGMFGAAPAFAESDVMPEPDVTVITPATRTQYKDDLYYSSSFVNTACDNYTLNYRYYRPDDMSKKVPLVICLHGRGERGSDNDIQLNNAFVRPFIENKDSKFYGAMVVAPQCPVKPLNNGWVNLFTNEDDSANLNYKPFSVDAVEESVECKTIVALVEELCKKNNIDRNRIYLIGLSQGAMATWDLLARHSDLFAAAVPISGVGDPTKAEIYANIPIYAFHGQEDTTVPYDRGTTVVYEAVNKLGKNKMHFVSFSDGPHAIWEAAIVFKGNDKVPGLEDWLFSR